MKRQPYTDIENYILDSIDGSSYDKDLPFIEDKLKFLYETFLTEYGWHIEQVGVFKALTSWLQGLPSTINIEWRNHLIIQLGQSWNLLKPNADEKEIDKFLEKWFRFMAMRIHSLWTRHNIL